MPFWRSYGHFVWATKNREAHIAASFEQRLFEQVVNKAAENGCYVYAINGMPDHIHVVLTFPPKLSVADVAKVLKGSSAHFVNHIIRPPEYHFAWQRGYGYLSLGHRQVADAIAYVERQKEHHAHGTCNLWLERCSDVDEGPTIYATAEDKVKVVRENADVQYSIEELPF